MVTTAAVILSFYAALISIGIAAWVFGKKKDAKSSKNNSGARISLIIPFRNEAKTLPTLLDHLDYQDLDTLYWTCYFVDDHSEDNGTKIITERLKPNYVLLTSPGHGKKNALKTALGIIQSAWVVQTDADCMMGPGWLSAMYGLIRDDNKMFCTAPVMVAQPVSLLDHFQALEMMALMGMTQAGLYTSWWNMANGANMMYTQDLAHRLYNDPDIQLYASGDDMSLVYTASTDPDQTILFNHAPQSIVYTAACKNVKTIINQRLRWSTKNFKSKDVGLKAALAIVLATNMMMISALILPMIVPRCLVFCLGLWVAKMMIDYVYIRVLSPFYQYTIPVSKFLISGFLYPFYITFVFILSIFKKNYEWKGRIAR